MDCCGHRYYTRRASSHPPRPRLHTKTQSVAWDPGGPRGGDGSKRHFVVVVVFFFSFSVVFARPQVSTDPGEEGGYVGRGNAEAAEEKVSISINEGGGAAWTTAAELMSQTGATGRITRMYVRCQGRAMYVYRLLRFPCPVYHAGFFFLLLFFSSLLRWGRSGKHDISM